MNRPITKNLHGLIDYSYAVTVPLLPYVVGFENETNAKTICQGLGAAALGYSLLTEARWGLVRLLPFKAHLAVDFTASCLALASPWIFSFSRAGKARNVLIAVGLISLAASLLTNPDDDFEYEQPALFI